MARTGEVFIKLAELLSIVPQKEVSGDPEIEINKIEFDSRNVTEGDIFVALVGANLDGHDFIGDAVSKGAKCIVAEKPVDVSVPVAITVPDSRHALALLASKYYNFPSRHMKIIGITGTNGKTTVAYLIRAIYRARGRDVGLISTIEYLAGKHRFEAFNTTPESLQIEQLLTIMRAERLRLCVMEVSSHALKTGRVRMIDFNTVGITNLSQDHLDFHGTMEDYRETKAMLFDRVRGKDKWAILNADDPEFDFFMGHVDSSYITYSIKGNKADMRAEKIETGAEGSAFTLVTPLGEEKIKINLPGEHNVSNAVCAAALAMGSGVDVGTVKRGLESVSFIPGRLEPLENDRGIKMYIDYAHTPDALENVCSIGKRLAREEDSEGNVVREGKLVVLFGCGGDRDKTKRKPMAEAVCRYADKVVLTSDNPRTEDPQAIIDDAKRGINSSVESAIEPDRTKALKIALDMASTGDVLILAGKGHENYQIIGTEKTPFDDRAIIREYMSQG